MQKWIGETSFSVVLVENGSSLDQGIRHGKKQKGLRDIWDKLNRTC